MASGEETSGTKPKRKIRFGRIGIALATLFVIGIVGYGTSWYNSRKYFLIKESGRVRIAKGRFFVTGHDSFIPRTAELRKAYRTVTLPEGMPAKDGTQTFTDRVELDQALYQVLKSAMDFALTKNDGRTPELMARYLAQIDALPGLNGEQRQSIVQLRKDAGYVEARGYLEQARTLLEKAETKFRDAAIGGGRYVDAGARADAVRLALSMLKESPAAAAAAPAARPSSPAPSAPPKGVSTAPVGESTPPPETARKDATPADASPPPAAGPAAPSGPTESTPTPVASRPIGALTSSTTATTAGQLD